MPIDGVTLRTGSANLSTSGENMQDYDLIVIDDGGGSADAFEAHFERMWRAAAPMIEFGAAIDALEPREETTSEYKCGGVTKGCFSRLKPERPGTNLTEQKRPRKSGAFRTLT
jgi:hypothetical protein